jgi:16S rRNA (guanine527-N7)-methyltransferase
MTPKEIRSILEGYFAPLPADIGYKVHKYMDLLDTWGRKMPLTSVRDHEEVVRFHFGESIFALSLRGIENGRLADVGSGAGFPGLAIKLASPELTVTLVEPNKKKCAFLHEVVRLLELHEVEIVPAGFESSGVATHSMDFITCRALGQHKAILDWAKDKFAASGDVLLWLGKQDCEQVAANSGWHWEDPALIPGTMGRFLLLGSPI